MLLPALPRDEPPRNPPLARTSLPRIRRPLLTQSGGSRAVNRRPSRAALRVEIQSGLRALSALYDGRAGTPAYNRQSEGSHDDSAH